MIDSSEPLSKSDNKNFEKQTFAEKLHFVVDQFPLDATLDVMVACTVGTMLRMGSIDTSEMTSENTQRHNALYAGLEELLRLLTHSDSEKEFMDAFDKEVTAHENDSD